MLTPRYNGMSSLLSDFRQIMEGMDEVQPTVEARRAKKLRLPDPVVGRAASGERIKASGKVEDVEEVEESVSSVYQYKVMAGLVEREIVPRDPGLFGATRFNEAYVQEGGGTRAKKAGRVAAVAARVLDPAFRKHFKGDVNKGKDTPAGKKHRMIRKLMKNKLSRGVDQLALRADPKREPAMGYTMGRKGDRPVEKSLPRSVIGNRDMTDLLLRKAEKQGKKVFYFKNT